MEEKRQGYKETKTMEKTRKQADRQKAKLKPPVTKKVAPIRRRNNGDERRGNGVEKTKTEYESIN